jgi:hypothetical protein
LIQAFGKRINKRRRSGTEQEKIGAAPFVPVIKEDKE